MASSLLLRDPRLLFPPFFENFKVGLDKAQKDGHPVKIFETFRSPRRQQTLYNQGRTTTGPIITQARPWQSWHQYGLAADVAFFERNAWHWEFDPSKIARYFEGLNITWGGPKDGPHFQHAPLPKITAAQAITAENNSLLAFWASLL